MFVVPIAKMKVMTPRQTLRIIFLPLVPPPPPLPLLASDESDTLLEIRGKEEELPCSTCCCCWNAAVDGSIASCSMDGWMGRH